MILLYLGPPCKHLLSLQQSAAQELSGMDVLNTSGSTVNFFCINSSLPLTHVELWCSHHPASSNSVG